MITTDEANILLIETLLNYLEGLVSNNGFVQILKDYIQIIPKNKTKNYYLRSQITVLIKLVQRSPEDVRTVKLVVSDILKVLIHENLN